jgi:hypothetical protein
MNSPLRHAAPWIPSLLLLPALATAQIPIGPGTPITPQPVVTFSPDVLLYGTPSGGGANPNSRVQVFGFPRPGTTIVLQVVGAPANATASFVVGTGWSDQQVPGLGRVLVDANGAVTYTAPTDGNGRATVPLTVPNSAQAGDEFFVQCTTTAGTGAAPELSSAAWFEVGTAAKPIGMVSHLFGTISVSGLGPVVASPGVSGICAWEWAPRTGGAIGGVAMHVRAGAIACNGTLIEDLSITPAATSVPLSWTASNFMRVPAGTNERFFVTFSSGGQNFGPYEVAGQFAAALGDVTAAIGPIPSLASNPLAGASIHLDLNEQLLGPDYFAALDNIGLVSGLAAGLALDDRLVDQQFRQSRPRMQAALAAHTGDASFFSAHAPNYREFLAAEAVTLGILTDGRASSNEDVLVMIQSGQLDSWQGWLDLIWAKIGAFFGIVGIADGIYSVWHSECGELLKELKQHIDNGDYRKAAKTLGKMFDKMQSKSFIKKIVEKVGPEKAGKLLKKIGAKFLPVIGWVYSTLDLIWTFVEQWLD